MLPESLLGHTRGKLCRSWTQPLEHQIRPREAGMGKKSGATRWRRCMNRTKSIRIIHKTP